MKHLHALALLAVLAAFPATGFLSAQREGDSAPPPEAGTEQVSIPSPSPSGAAEPSPPPPAPSGTRDRIRPARVRVIVSFRPDIPFPGGVAGMLEDSLRFALTPGQDENWILLLPGRDDGIPADLQCLVTVEGSMDALGARMEILVRDPGTGKVASAGTGEEVRGRIDPYFRNIFAGFWRPLHRQLGKIAGLMREYTTLTIQGQAGTQVLIDGLPPLDIGADGEITVVMPLACDVRMQTRHQAFQDRDMTFFLDTPRVIDLGQTPRQSYSLQGWLHWLHTPGIGIWYPLANDSGIPAEAGCFAEFWNLSLMPSSPDSESPGFFTDFERIDLGVAIRMWTGPDTEGFRMGLGLEASIHLDTARWFLPDQDEPLSVALQVPLELRLPGGFSLCFELLPTLTLVPDPDLVLYSQAVTMESGLMGNMDFMNFSLVAGSFLFEPFHIRAGVRWRP